MAMKKASKGKRGCLKPNGRLKKGFKWAKSRRGYCVSVAAKKKSSSRKRKSTKRSAAAKRAAATRKARAAAAILAAEGQSLIASRAMDGI